MRDKMSDGRYCNFKCKHFREYFEDDDPNMDISFCDLGHSEIHNREFCKDYEE